MKKKQIIGLCTLLLVFLLGLSTTLYADDLGTTFVEQVITLSNSSNAVTNNGYISAIYSTFNNNRSYFSSAENYFSQYDYFIVESLNQYDSSAGLEYYTRNMVLYFFNCPDNVNLRIVNGDFTFNSNIDYRVIRFRNGNINSNITYNGNSFTLHLYQLVTNYDKEIKNDDNTVNSSINSAYNEGFFTSIGFTFLPKPSAETADVYYFEDIPLYNASGEDLYLGQLFMPTGTNIIYWTKDNYYYRYGDWNIRQLPVDSIYLEYFTTDNDVAVYDVYLQSKYIYENTIYSSVWADASTEPYTLAYTNFYIKNNNTIVSNGVINPSQTFSGDYKDKYDNDIDNQEDINNIEEAIGDTILDDSEVDNMLSGFNTSGDILNTLGYSPIENPFSSVILRVMQALNDVLLGSGDVTLDISAFDLDMVLNSSDFTLPAGLIKNFVSLVSNGFVIWLIYKYGFKLYMMINTGKFKNLIDETTNTNVNLF